MLSLTWKCGLADSVQSQDKNILVIDLIVTKKQEDLKNACSLSKLR